MELCTYASYVCVWVYLETHGPLFIGSRPIDQMFLFRLCVKEIGEWPYEFQ